MRPTSKSLLLFLSICIYFSSCTIEKRRYQAGYFIDWKNKKENSKRYNDEIRKSDDADFSGSNTTMIRTTEVESIPSNTVAPSSNFASTNAEIEIIPQPKSLLSKSTPTVRSISNVRTKKEAYKSAKKLYKLSSKERTNSKRSSNHKLDPLLELLIYIVLGGANLYGLNYRPSIFGVIMLIVLMVFIIWTLAVLLLII